MAHFNALQDGFDDFKVKVPCRVRSLFDQVVLHFLKMVCVNKDVIRAFPPKLCDGVEADLFTLFRVVRDIGDYEMVSKNELWEWVAKECGLDITYVGCLKLIYVEYLKEFHQWLNRGGFKDTDFENAEGGVEKLDSLFRELRECKYNLSGVGFEIGKKGKCVGIESSNEKLDLDMSKSEMGFSRNNNVGVKDEKLNGLDLNKDISEMGFTRISNVDKKDEEFGGLDLNIVKSEKGFSRISNVDKKGEEFSLLNEKRTELSRETAVMKVDISGNKDDNDKNVVICPVNAYSFKSNNNEHNDTTDNDNNTMIFTKTIVKNVRKKRKKEESLSVSKLLDWVANAARDPHDNAIGRIPKCTKWKKYKGNEVWKQVLTLKETFFANRNVDSGNNVYGSQKKRHMMHPSMYEDDRNPIHLPSKRIRCSQRASSVKACSCPGCTSCSSSKSKRHKPDVKKIPQILETIETQDNVCDDLKSERVDVRAEVPEWTGVVSQSDPKWLGTQTWPPPEDNNDNEKRETDFLVIGKGRESSCTCPFPGSADCVRFHIAENRTKLTRTLGPLFYKWKFDHMGEEASVSLWSQEEETEFKILVIKARQELTDKSKSRHEIMCNFWRGASASIPLKTKDMLVSYYFNVFVLRRRSYQNRIMPENIDSDDDEQEVGYEKIHALSVKNAEFMNLDGVGFVHI